MSLTRGSVTQSSSNPRAFLKRCQSRVGRGVGQRGGSGAVHEATSSGAFKFSNLGGGNRMGLAQTWFRKSKGLFNQG